MKRVVVFLLSIVMVFVAFLAIADRAYAAENAEGVAIDAEHFPDEAFRRCVSSYYDKDHNGVLSEEEIAAVTKMSLSFENIASLDGIEYFRELVKLELTANPITALDVSKNVFLKELKCGNNMLEHLNVSGCAELEVLYCDNNKLKQLDISRNTVLTDLICSGNVLTELDLSNNTALTELSCLGNQLSTLDLSWNTALMSAYCSDNELIEIKPNAELMFLDCNNNQLSSIDVSGCQNLRHLYVGNNGLDHIDVTQNKALYLLHCQDNKLTSLDLSQNAVFTVLNCSSNLLTVLDLSKNQLLESLNCAGNQLTGLDVSRSPELYYLRCEFNQIGSLDVRNCVFLEQLYCYGNNISELDISQCSNMLKAYTEGSRYEREDEGLAYYEYTNETEYGGGSYLGVDKNTNIITVSELKTATVSGISLNLEGRISVQFKIKPSDDAAYAELRYEKEEGGYGDVVAKISLDKATSPAYQAGSDIFLVSYSEITSREMTLHVMLNIIDKDGNPMKIYRTTNQKTYEPDELVFCAADWANAIIDKYGTNKSNKSSWMAMALLNFGQEAQKYFKDFNSDAPANPKNYLADDMSSFKVDTVNNNVESANARKYGFSGSALDLAADTTLRVKFNGNYAVKLDGKTASTILDSGKYVLDITGLRCIDLDQKFTVTFTGDGGSGTLTLSALGWCNAIIDKFGLDDTNQSSRLARAVCLYSQAAENYFK